MKLNRDVLILDIVKYQSVFFKLLDYIEQHENSYEFPEINYITLYNTVICEGEDTNAEIHLSFDSLLENGIFIHHNKLNGMVTLEPLVVDLLRFIDVKRIRELSYVQFENMRNAIENTVCIIINKSNYQSDEYKEAIKAFNELMGDILGKIKKNIHSLQYQVGQISSQYKKYDTGDASISVATLYESIDNLYQRYVLPCFEFIDPNMEMKNKKTFNDSVDELIHFHSSNKIKDYEVADLIIFNKKAITSYYKDVGKLARQLNQYSKYLESDRLHYLSIDNAYNELMDNIIPLRHGKQKNIYLKPELEFLKKYHIFDGLANVRTNYAPKITLNKSTTISDFNEFLRCYVESSPKEPKNKLKPLIRKKNTNENRILKISQLCINQKWESKIEDIHLHLNNFLKNELEDYQLPDLLIGLQVVFGLKIEKDFKYIREKKVVEDSKYYLEYLVIKHSPRVKKCTV